MWNNLYWLDKVGQIRLEPLPCLFASAAWPHNGKYIGNMKYVPKYNEGPNKGSLRHNDVKHECMYGNQQ